MKLQFYWSGIFGSAEPCCKSDRVGKGGIGVLENILMDDGGIGCLASIPWLLEGISRVRLVKSGQWAEADWGRETWGAQIQPREVRLYSLHDDKFAEVIETDKFEIALLEWIKFVQVGSRLGEVHEIEI
jgi:hypothetical protein